MKEYHDDLRKILDSGEVTTDRTGVGTTSYFGLQTRYDLSKGLPVLTTKKLHLKSIIHELLWFLSGDTNIKYLKDNGVRIWDEWADENGDLGPVYGRQWRSFSGLEAAGDLNGDPVYKRHGVDQISNLMDSIKNSPDSRRLIVTGWNPAEVVDMALPPCHMIWQVKVIGSKIHLQLYQRSADFFLGVPFNICSYAILLEMLAHVTGYEAGDFIHTIGDAHIYSNHMDQVEELLSRDVRALPRLKIKRKVESIFDFKFDDFEIVDYDPHPAIKAEVAV